MYQCKTCGKQYPSKVNFCGNCGSVVSINSDVDHGISQNYNQSFQFSQPLTQQQLLQPPSYAVKVKQSHMFQIDRTNSLQLLIIAAITGLVFTICFAGNKIQPFLSLFVFSIVATFVIYYLVKQLGYLQNQKGLIWAVPIFAVAGLNATFSMNPFTYANCLLLFLLFGLYTVSLISSKPLLTNFYTAWMNLIHVLFPRQLGVTFFIIKKFILKKSDSVSEKPKVFSKILIGVLIAMPVLLIIFGLLAGADLIFQKLIEDSLGGINRFLYQLSFGSFLWDVIIFFIATFYFVGFIYSAHVFSKNFQAPANRLKADRIISLTFLTLLNLLFLIFCIIQFAFLFTGGHATLPEGFTFSEYARKGFFELLFVTCINFTVVIVFLYLLKNMQQNKAVKAMLLLLCFFTAVLICSSFYRMFLYIDSYGYTFLRMAVLVFLVMESILILLTAVYLMYQKFNIFRIAVLICLCFYLLANILTNQTAVSQLNIARYHQTGMLDIENFVENPSVNSLHPLKKLVQEENSQHATELNKAITTIKSLNETQDSHWQNYTLMKYLGLME